MDNASKALIMAGAILIAVAIVGIGIYIFSSANSLTNNAVGQIDAIQVQMFNQEFTKFADEGETVNGTRARQLYDTAKANKVTVEGGPTFDARQGYVVHFEYDTNTQYINKVTIGN